MRLARPLILFSTLLLAAGLAAAQARDGEWVSYRDVYRSMVVFEKYGGAKSLLQAQLQVTAREPGAEQAAHLTLSGKSTQLNLPLDATGRTTLPLLKAAYDENAVLVLGSRGGSFVVRPRVSIALRADGIYDTADLRTACEEAAGFARYVDRSFGRKHCSAVRFVFAKKGEAPMQARRAGGGRSTLQVTEDVAFPGDADASFPVVVYRFVGDERTQLVTSKAPLAIVPLFE
jgi:hypothetical protein